MIAKSEKRKIAKWERQNLRNGNELLRNGNEPLRNGTSPEHYAVLVGNG
jgi:hypothetical protein